MFERLNFYHFRADALQQKLLYLLSDVFEEGCARHLPISMIEKTGTPARYIAIAAPERMDLVLISDLRIPSIVSPIATTPSRHKSAIISLLSLERY